MDRRLECFALQNLEHEEEAEEIRAGWVHFIFAVLYAAACWWHFGAAREHWDRSQFFTVGESRSLSRSQLQLKKYAPKQN